MEWAQQTAQHAANIADKFTYGGAAGGATAGIWVFFNENGVALAAICGIISVSIAVISAIISNYIKIHEFKKRNND